MFMLRWVNALESNRYRQGRGSLCQIVNGVPHYCVFGVLGDLLVKDGKAQWINIGPSKGLQYKNESSLYALREDWLRELNIPLSIVRDIDPRYIPRAMDHRVHIETNSLSLIELNDEGYPFARLATIIRRVVNIHA